MLVAERYDTLMVKTFFTLYLKVVLIPEEYISPYAPHIVYPVGIEKIHRPPLTLGREAAEHKQSCPLGQKGL
jgi:hypothetical protein